MAGSACAATAFILLYISCLRLFSALRVLLGYLPGTVPTFVVMKRESSTPSARGWRPTVGRLSARSNSATSWQDVATRSYTRRRRERRPPWAWTSTRCTGSCFVACRPARLASLSLLSSCRRRRCQPLSGCPLGSVNCLGSRSTQWMTAAAWSITTARESHRTDSGAGQHAGVAGSRVAAGHRAATRSALDAVRRRADSEASGRRLGAGHVNDVGAVLHHWRMADWVAVVSSLGDALIGSVIAPALLHRRERVAARGEVRVRSLRWRRLSSVRAMRRS